MFFPSTVGGNSGGIWSFGWPKQEQTRTTLSQNLHLCTAGRERKKHQFREGTLWAFGKIYQPIFLLATQKIRVTIPCIRDSRFGSHQEDQRRQHRPHDSLLAPWRCIKTAR
jgi:hypothetical protein